MEYRVLGNTGLKISSFVLGTGTFGFWGNNTEKEAAVMLDEALAGGINLIDTADVYSSGQSEEILGHILKGRRQDVILATKGGMPMGIGLNQSGNSKYWIKRAVEGSLRRLQTDYIDLYQLHQRISILTLKRVLTHLRTWFVKGRFAILVHPIFRHGK